MCSGSACRARRKIRRRPLAGSTKARSWCFSIAAIIGNAAMSSPKARRAGSWLRAFTLCASGCGLLRLSLTAAAMSSKALTTLSSWLWLSTACRDGTSWASVHWRCGACDVADRRRWHQSCHSRCDHRREHFSRAVSQRGAAGRKSIGPSSEAPRAANEDYSGDPGGPAEECDLACAQREGQGETALVLACLRALSNLTKASRSAHRPRCAAGACDLACDSGLGPNSLARRLPLRPQHAPLYPVKGVFHELAIEQASRIDGARKNEPARRHRLKSHPPIIGHIANEEDQAVSGSAGGLERSFDERLADSARAEGRVDGERPKEQRRVLSAMDERHPVGAHKQSADSCDKGEAVIGGDAFAQPVGGAGEPAWPEGMLVEFFDRRVIGRGLGAERQRQVSHWRLGEGFELGTRGLAVRVPYPADRALS